MSGHSRWAGINFHRDKDFWNNLGYLYMRMDRKEDALNAYERALRLDFQFDVAWKNLNVALRALGRRTHPFLQVPGLWKNIQRKMDGQDWGGARRDAEKLSALATESLPANLVLANLAARTRDFDLAVQHYQKVLSWKSSHWEARLNLSKVYAQQGHQSEALDLARQLVKERPQDKEATELLRSLTAETPSL